MFHHQCVRPFEIGLLLELICICISILIPNCILYSEPIQCKFYITFTPLHTTKSWGRVQCQYQAWRNLTALLTYILLLVYYMLLWWHWHLDSTYVMSLNASQPFHKLTLLHATCHVLLTQNGIRTVVQDSIVRIW